MHIIQEQNRDEKIFVGGREEKEKYRHTLSIHSIPDSKRCTIISPDSTLPLLTHVTCYFICISAPTFHTH